MSVNLHFDILTMAPSWSDLPQEVRDLVFDKMLTPYVLDLNITNTLIYPWTNIELVNHDFHDQVQDAIRRNGPKVLHITGNRTQVFQLTRTKSLQRVKSVEWKELWTNFDQAVDLAKEKDMQEWLNGEVALWAAFSSPMATGQVSGTLVSRHLQSSMNWITGKSEWCEDYEIVVKVSF